MTKKEQTSDAVQILRNRYVKDDPERKASVEAERVNAQVARMIYDLRNDAGLTQKELAELVGTTQSVISRLEDADYEGHSLSMLNRIAEALKQKMTVVMTAKDPEVGGMRHAFHLVVQMLRRRHGLTVDKLAQRADIDRNEIIAMERNSAYRPSPLTLHKLCSVYKIPEKRMLVLAGAVKATPQGFSERASGFAAQSESFAKLTREEQKVLDEFVQFLKEDE
ncbi:MAG: helix-turn-helix domain-containing protein [Planctomycetes bacterium]|nr:helix-turn-helix domain-containing protein [Planctomycetota bacterium]